jgi:plasmid segregation protein ParM
MSAQTVIYAGVDGGHREVKLTLSTGLRIMSSSSAMSGLSQRISLNGGKSRVFSYNTDDGPFTLGDIENAEDTAYDEYPYSAQNRAIVTHALRMAGLDSSHQLVTASGLPLKRFYVSNKPNVALIKQKKANLLRNDVTGLDGYAPPTIIKHEVMAEAVAGWVNYVVQRDAANKLYIDSERVKQRTAIVDIGGRTLDIAVVKDWDIDFSRSTTDNMGMITIINGIKDRLFDFFGGIEPTDEQVDQALKEGTVLHFGKVMNVNDLVESAVQAVVNSLRSTIKSKLKNAHDIHTIRFIGGTSKFLERHIKGWFENQQMSDNPAFENSDGMCKHAELVASLK